MKLTFQEWIAVPLIALGCLGGISELKAVEEKPFTEADKAFVVQGQSGS